MHFLITGFGAFLGHELNPAGEVAKALGGGDVSSFVLNVSYKEVKQELPLLIKKTNPDFIVSFGLAASRPTLSLERYGYNEMNCSHPDVAGAIKLGEPISFGAKSRLETPLDLSALQTRLAEQGIVSDLSEDPGRYICNEIYYLDLSSGVPSLFVHLPNFENAPLEQDLKAAHAILDEIRRQKR